MIRALRVFCILTLLAVTSSCSDIAFRARAKGTGASQSDCRGDACPRGIYTWFEGGFGMCSKPCGGGSQTQTVECRRSSDNVAVEESFCSSTRPQSVRTCNVQTCSGPYAWNLGAFGECSKTCGSGVRSRSVLCQDQNGASADEANCPQPKPATSETCNTDPCTTVSYSWHVTAGPCSRECGGGTATDTVVCKKNDGTTVADSFCSSSTKPPTTRNCNVQSCPAPNYSYQWEAGAWSTCSRECGDGLQTRSVTCRRNDGAFVDGSLCSASSRPATEQACRLADCSATRSVTQNAYVTPASNSVDVILIIDDSASMKEDQTKLATRMAGLLSDLDAANIDYQVCLTTTDIAYYRGSPIKWKGPETFIMNKNTPNKNAVFIQTIDSLGAEWSSDEQGIKAMYMMIRDFRASGCLRPQAALTTILVSDENERSVGGNQSWSQSQYQPLTSENQPDTLINFVRSTFNTSSFTKPFIWNSIIVKPGDTACEQTQDAQSPSFFGTLYADLSARTNGHIGSICDSDYAQNLRYIRERTVNNMPGLTMECTPTDVPVVTFDQTVNTTISVEGNQIRFSPAIPENVRITARYTCPN